MTRRRPHANAVTVAAAIWITSTLLLGAATTAPTPAGAQTTVATTPAAAAPAITPQAYLAIALDFIESSAYRRQFIDWTAVRADATAQGAKATTIADTYPIIIKAIRALDDKHSSFTKPPEAVQQTAGLRNGFGFVASAPSRIVVSVAAGSPAEKAGLKPGDRIEKIDGKTPATVDRIVIIKLAPGQTSVKLTWSRKGVKKLFTKVLTLAPVTMISVPKATTLPPVPGVEGQSLGKLAYIDVPGIVGNDAAQRAFATQLQTQIAALETTQARCGWIVDLRRNRGGYTYAMLGGLGPLLEADGNNNDPTNPERLGGQQNAAGRQWWWSYSNGILKVDDQTVMNVDTPFKLAHPNIAIAVLTSNLTASAGEAVTIAFRGRPETRSFGDTTVGLTTFNERRTMPDGAFLDLMTAVHIDRAGSAYDGTVAPDEPVTIDWANIATENDPVLARATHWLSTQPACTT